MVSPIAKSMQLMMGTRVHCKHTDIIYHMPLRDVGVGLAIVGVGEDVLLHCELAVRYVECCQATRTDRVSAPDMQAHYQMCQDGITACGV